MTHPEHRLTWWDGKHRPIATLALGATAIHVALRQDASTDDSIAAAGYLPPVAGAVAQEIIDVVAVLNALRVAIAPTRLSDF
ncbi:MAG: hypothetical protein O3C40_15990 [Planctomycetota bacterium]|nr:hypothetical protein [Planctomycetota bacterium]